MGFFWSEELSIGVESVDEYRREMFVRYNRFLNDCKNGSGRTHLSELLSFLGGEVISRFADEERVMADCSYPDSNRHIEQHRDIARTIDSFRGQIGERGASIKEITELNRFLLDWLVNHIKKSDVEFGGFLNRKWGLF